MRKQYTNATASSIIVAEEVICFVSHGLHVVLLEGNVAGNAVCCNIDMS